MCWCKEDSAGRKGGQPYRVICNAGAGIVAEFNKGGPGLLKGKCSTLAEGGGVVYFKVVRGGLPRGGGGFLAVGARVKGDFLRASGKDLLGSRLRLGRQTRGEQNTFFVPETKNRRTFELLRRNFARSKTTWAVRVFDI